MSHSERKDPQRVPSRTRNSKGYLSIDSAFQTCIEMFGADRCMFESNFPVEKMGSSWVTLWNAFKLIAAGSSADEKAALFSGTAQRAYRLDLA